MVLLTTIILRSCPTADSVAFDISPEPADLTDASSPNACATFDQLRGTSFPRKVEASVAYCIGATRAYAISTSGVAIWVVSRTCLSQAITAASFEAGTSLPKLVATSLISLSSVGQPSLFVKRLLKLDRSFCAKSSKGAVAFESFNEPSDRTALTRTR